MIFDTKMTFEKNLRSVTGAASQRLGIPRKSRNYSMIDCFLGDAFGVLSCPFWSSVNSAVWCSTADAHLKLLDRVVSGSGFLTGGVFQCDHSPRRSEAVLCMLYKIRCNPMHPLYGALAVTYLPVRITCQLFVGLAARSLLVSYCFPFLVFHYICWYCGAGSSDW